MNREPVPQPNLEKIPSRLKDNREVDGVKFLAATLPEHCQVLFVKGQLEEKECYSSWGNPAKIGKGPLGQILKRSCQRTGINWYKCGITSVIKWNLDGNKPKAAHVHASESILLDDIARAAPVCIVAVGKLAFKMLTGIDYKITEVAGGWFDLKPEFSGIRETGIPVYAMEDFSGATKKPEVIARLDTDLRQIASDLDAMLERPRKKLETDYRFIDKYDELFSLFNEVDDYAIRTGDWLLALDTEFGHGINHIDGKLRCFQFSWAPGKAAYVKLHDTEGNWAFDAPMQILQPLVKKFMDNPNRRFIGHYVATDLTWMHYHFGIDWYGRTAMDTGYALHCICETADMKLERLAMRYTDLGRYDIALLLEKKRLAIKDKDGYIAIPDEILFPYGCKDVDVCKRLYPIFMRELVKQDLLGYYCSICLPFTTDCFTESMLCGLPINTDYMEEMRVSYNAVHRWVEDQFIGEIIAEAKSLLRDKLAQLDSEWTEDLKSELSEFIEQFGESSTMKTAPDALLDKLKTQAGPQWNQLRPFLEHLTIAPGFNIKSTDHLRRWLFEVKGLTPVKSTKKGGIAVAWEKVMALEPSLKVNYTPAADKNTLKVFAQKDAMVAKLVEMNAVLNIVNGFMKEPDDDGDEEGLFKWVSADKRIHANLALTDTARTRTWKPNVLNYNKTVADGIKAAFKKFNEFVETCRSKGVSHVVLRSGYTLDVSKVYKAYSVRSNIQAPEGWCIVDSDYATAEVFALAYLSGDPVLIKVLTEPDRQYGLIPDGKGDFKAVRICYVQENTDIPASEQDTSILVAADDPRLVRLPDGSIKHPRRDIHWELAESTNKKPREKLDKGVHRNGAKVIIFSSPYGGTGTSLERQIEVVSGIKPEPGTGDALLAARAKKFPVSTRWLEEQEILPMNPGYAVGVAGRRRHFSYGEVEDITGLSDRAKDDILSPLKRKARNYKIQNAVAESMAVAQHALLTECRNLGLKARTMISMYDALTSICPLEERFIIQELHDKCMVQAVGWETLGGTLRFQIETDVEYRWGEKPTEEQLKQLRDRTWRTTCA